MFEEKIDVKETNIANIDYELFSILLKDRTTNKNIIWATDNYIEKGIGYEYKSEISPTRIIGSSGRVIKPRIKKSIQEQSDRIKKKAEVFTPSWICNKQNNMIDNAWFGYEDVFNKEIKDGWKTIKRKIIFESSKRMEEYIDSLRLEISCGEAPYLVSRYDTVTGNIIEIEERIGMLDRKLRVINENINEYDSWINYVIRAYKSIYGYDWQGDNVLLARENLLYTFIDNYKHKFNENPSIDIVKEIAEIISWNIFQMDGIKFVIPCSCENETSKEIHYDLFGEKINDKKECFGCKKNNNKKHNGIYVKIMNWNTKRQVKFVNLLKGVEKNGTK